MSTTRILTKRFALAGLRARSLGVVAILMAVLSVASRDAAAQVTWTGTTADGNWATLGAFSGSSGAVSLANNFNQSLVFAGASQLSSTNTLTGGTATGITFNADGFTLSGSAITLNGNITNNNTTGTNTINFAMNVPTSRSITGTGGYTLVLGGPITGSGTVTLTRTGGTPTYVLSGSNDFTGGLTFGSVNVRLQNSSALGRNTASNLISFGVTTVTNTAGALTLANNISFTGNTGANPTFNLAENPLEFTGTAFNNAGSQIVVSSGTLTLRTISGTGAGSASQGGQLQMNGTLLVKEASTFSGNWRTSTGTGWVLIGDGAALGTGTIGLQNASGTQLGTTKDLTISTRITNLAGGRIGGDYVLTVDQPITGTTSQAITKVGSGTLALTADNTFLGSLASGPGVIRISGSNAMSGVSLSSVGSGTVSAVSFESANALGAAGTLTVTGAINQTVTLSNLSASPVTLASTGAMNAYSNQNGILAFDGPRALTISASTWNFQGQSINVVSSTLTLAGSGTSAVGTNDGWSKDGAGTLRLTGSNSFAGNFRVADGVLLLDNPFALPGGIGVKSSGPTVRFNGGPGGVLGLTSGTLALTLSKTSTQGGIAWANANGSVVGPGGFAGFASDSTVYVALTLGGTTGAPLTFGVNDFVASGTTLILGASNATGTVDFQNPLNLNNAEQFIRADNGSAAVDGVLSGVVSNGRLTKTGLGTLALTAANTYTGTTTISAGTLQIGNNGATGSLSNSSPVSVSSGATLSFYRSNDVAYSGTVSGAGNLMQLGASTLTLTAAQVYTGTTTISTGTLQIGNGGAAGSISDSSPVSVASGAVLAFNRSDALTYGGTISGAGGLAKLGASTLTIGTQQSYTGATTITSGTLQIGNNGTTGALSRSSPVGVASGAALAFYRSDAIAYSGTVSGAGGLIKRGGSTLTLDTAHAYTGATSVSEGRLVVNGSILASSGVTVASGATLGGSGSVAAIGGAGLVSPGNSPGIMTSPAIDLTNGMDFAFEFTQAGSPTWSTGTASGNDVLRLTSLATPIVGAAGAGNVFDVYFAATGQTYRGGLFTDLASSFESSVAGATFNYYLLDGSGSISFNNNKYSPLDASQVTRSTAQVASADFAGGAPVTNGYTMQFIVVPEPAAVMLAGLGVGIAGWSLARRRRR